MSLGTQSGQGWDLRPPQRSSMRHQDPAHTGATRTQAQALQGNQAKLSPARGRGGGAKLDGRPQGQGRLREGQLLPTSARSRPLALSMVVVTHSPILIKITKTKKMILF